MNNKDMSILIVGVGGQGTLLTSRVLGRIALDKGLDVKVSEVHGMAQRGGSVVTHMKMGKKVYSPLVIDGCADVILAFEQLEAYRWISYLKTDGCIIINNQIIGPMPVITGAMEYPKDIVTKIKSRFKNVIDLNAMDIALELGNIKVANIVLLGVLAKYIEIEKGLCINAIKRIVPEKTVMVNLEAFERGYNL